MSTTTPATQTPRMSRLAVIGGTGLLCLTGISQTENRNLHAANLQWEKAAHSWQQSSEEKGAKIVMLDKSLVETREQLAFSQDRNATLVSQNGVLNTKVNGLTDQLKTTTGKFDKAKYDLAAMTDKAGKLDRELANSNKNAELLKSEVEAGGKRELTMKETITSLEKAKTELASAIALKEAQLKSLDGEKSELAKQLTGHQEMLAAEQEKAKALATTNEGMSKELSTTKKAVDTLNEEKTQLVAARDELIKKLTDLDSQVKLLQEKNKGQENANQQLKEERDTLDAQTSKLSTQVKGLNSQMESMAAQATTQQALVTTLGQERDTLKVERDQLTGACSELMRKLEQLSKQVKILQSDFLTLRRLKEEASASLTTTPAAP